MRLVHIDFVSALRYIKILTNNETWKFKDVLAPAREKSSEFIFTAK